MTTCILNHVVYLVTENNFYSHKQARKIDEYDKELVKGLMRARTNAKNIADVLSEWIGKSFKTQDVNVGDARYLKEEGSNNVDVLWVQTRDMRNQRLM